jgi:hypothetical protein
MESFADSFFRGWQINQQDEAQNRLAQVQQMQQIAQVMQFQKMAQELQRQAQTQRAIESIYSDPETRKMLGPNAEALRPFLSSPSVQDELVKGLMPKGPQSFTLGPGQKRLIPDNTAPGGYREISGPAKEPSSLYADFATGYKAKLKAENPGITDTELSSRTAEEARRLKIEEMKETLPLRIPAYSVAPNMPPGYTFNRRTGKYEYDPATPVGGNTVKDLPGIGATFGADKKALDAVTKAKDQVMAFEKTATKNLEYAASLSERLARTGFPPANALLIALRTKTGDPETVKFSTAVYAAALEYQKVITAGSGVTSAELSVGAQKKAEEIISKSHTKEQFRANLEALKIDMQNRKLAYGEQIKEIQGRIGSVNAPGSNLPPTDVKLTGEEAQRLTLMGDEEKAVFLDKKRKEQAGAQPAAKRYRIMRVQ